MQLNLILIFCFLGEGRLPNPFGFEGKVWTIPFWPIEKSDKTLVALCRSINKFSFRFLKRGNPGFIPRPLILEERETVVLLKRGESGSISRSLVLKEGETVVLTIRANHLPFGRIIWS